MWYVYLIRSKSTNIRYVGSTNDLMRRLREHNSGKSQYTRILSDWEYCYYDSYNDETEARKAERLIKKNKKYRTEFYEKAQAGLSSWRKPDRGS